MKTWNLVLVGKDIKWFKSFCLERCNDMFISDILLKWHVTTGCDKNNHLKVNSPLTLRIQEKEKSPQNVFEALESEVGVIAKNVQVSSFSQEV